MKTYTVEGEIEVLAFGDPSICPYRKDWEAETPQAAMTLAMEHLRRVYGKELLRGNLGVEGYTTPCAPLHQHGPQRTQPIRVADSRYSTYVDSGGES